MSLRKRMCLGLIFSLALVSVIGSFNCPNLWRLYRHGALAVGQITGLEPSNHNMVYYSFVAQKATYRGSEQGFSRAANAGVGDPVEIYYWPPNPNVSLPEDPSPKLWNEVLTVMAAGTVFPLLLIAGLGSKQRTRSRRA
jgi:hypothetical protein